MTTEAPSRKLAAILHADVVNYSGLMGADETGTHRTLREYLDAITATVTAHQGRVVNYAGDAVLADFTTVTDALSCAVAIQDDLQARNALLDNERQVLFRMGVNLGEVIVDGDDIYGGGVNVAARLESLADPGDICISGTVYDAIGNQLPHLQYAFMGEQTVKNIAQPVRTYRVVAADGDIEQGLPACPYPGMVPFAAKDAAYFYGRDDEISRMVQLLRRQRFLMVIGPSGSGKSSLVYAGLLPALAKSRYFTEGYWLIRPMRPGPQPTEALAKVLGAEDTQDQFDPDTVDTLLKLNPPAERLLLLVDQFEEVFTQADKDERARFIAELQALRAPDNCALILTLRADFYPDLMNSYLWPVDSSQRIEVAPLRGQALRVAIEQPAANVGVRIEESLINQLLIDAADEPGVLPLLQETMGLLWEEMEQRSLSLDAYQQLSRQAGLDDNGDLSGLAVAIAMKADSTLLELSPSQQAIARRIFLRLIQFGEGRADTRRQQPVSALRAATDEPDELEHTLEHLTDNRLLTRSGGDEQHPSAVDISHESLINGWSRLQDWAEERREAEQIRRRLEGKATEWVRLGKGTGGLLSDVELPEAEHWLASADAADLGFDETLPELVTASQQAIEQAEQEREDSRQRELVQAQALADEKSRTATRMRRSMFGLAAILLVAVAASIFAWVQSQKADARRIEAQQAEQEAKRLAGAEALARTQSEARRAEAENARLASIAQLLLIQAPQQQDSLADERGALFARQAYHFSRNGGQRLQEQIDGALRSVIGKPHFSSILRTAAAQSVAISPDSSQLASSHGIEGEIMLWDLVQPSSPPILLSGFPQSSASLFVYLAYSPDGNTLLAANTDGAVGQWDLNNPQAPMVERTRQDSGVWSAAFSSDGRWLAQGSRSKDNFVLWDISRPNSPPLSLDNPEAIILTGNELEVGKPGGVPVAFSPDSQWLATGGFNGTIWLWQLSDLTAPMLSLRGHEGVMTALAFFDNGNHLVSGGQDGTVRLWNLKQTTQPSIVLDNGISTSAIRSLSISADDSTLAVAGGEGSTLWQIDSLSPEPLTLQRANVWQVIFSGDGRYLVSAGAPTNLLRLFDIQPSGQPRKLAGRSTSVAFSADGALLATGGGIGDGKIRLWRWDELKTSPVIIQAYDGSVNSLEFSADSRELLSASWNGGSIKLWRLNRVTPTATEFPVPNDLMAWTARFGPGVKSISASGLNGAFIWSSDYPNAATQLLLPSKSWSTEIDFSPDKKYLAMSGLGAPLLIKNISRPEQPAVVLDGHTGGAHTVTFSPDGQTLASGGIDGAVRLWDPNLPDKPAITIGQHDAPVIRVRFSPNGKQLASASKDQSVRLWDIESEKTTPIVLTRQSGEYWSLAYSPDGQYLVAGGTSETTKIWDLTHPLNSLTTSAIADKVCGKVLRNLTLDEWHKFIGEDIPYQRTCENLPVHPSLFETAEKLAKEGNKEKAMTLLERAIELDTTLKINPQKKIEQWLQSANQ